MGFIDGIRHLSFSVGNLLLAKHNQLFFYSFLSKGLIMVALEEIHTGDYQQIPLDFTIHSLYPLLDKILLLLVSQSL